MKFEKEQIDLNDVYDGDFDFCPSDEIMLEPHEIIACFKRADQLEAYINQQLAFNKNNKLNVCVQFRAEIQFDVENCLSYNERQLYNYFYYFEFIVEQVWRSKPSTFKYVKCPLLDATNEDALKYLNYSLNQKQKR